MENKKYFSRSGKNNSISSAGKLKKKIQRNYFFLLFCFFLGGGITVFSQTISAHFFGENAWMPDTIGNANACQSPPCILYGKLHKQWNTIKNSGASIIRFGGNAPDKNMPTNFQYIKMIDSIRAKGMEPIIQVPFYKYRYTAQQAANIVQYINITRAKNVKYWIIGNEPDLSYSYTTSAQVANYIKLFASEMKKADPSILIVGPECAWFNQAIINGLTSAGGPDDITGTDANGRYYIDIISFHTYPFNGTQTRSQVISKLTSAGSLNDNLAYLNARIASCNTFHNRSGSAALKTAITEANIDWQNSSTDDLNGVGANSFIGGQFWAEMMGIGMKNNLDFINFWSVIEGNNTALNIGYIDAVNSNKKPSYYHLQLLANNFRGTFANGTTNNSNVKSFGCNDGQQISVLIMNEDLVTNLNYTVRLNTGTVSGTDPLKINIDAGVGSEYTGTINNQTTILLTFNSAGTIIQKLEYSLAGNAALNLPPTLTTFGALPIELLSFDAVLTDQKTVEFNWVTATETNNNYFTIQKTTDGVNFEDVKKIGGAGTSSHINYYHATDNDPGEGLSYYRLKQTDYNGEFSYSDLKRIELDSEKDLVLFPNPSDGREMNLRMYSRRDEEISVSVYDMQGREMVSEKFDKTRGSQVKTIIIPNKLFPGTYFVIISSSGVIQKRKLIVE